MQRIIFIISFLITSFLATAQEKIEHVAKAHDKSGVTEARADSLKHWNIAGSGNIAFAQAAFSNWAAGGDNSIGLDAFVNLKASYYKNKHAWTNTLDLGYGFQVLGVGKEEDFRKTNDKLEFTTAYGYQIHKNKKWFLTALANVRTQFANGYNYPDDSTVISKFMAPGYLLAGIGITYVPVKGFYMYLSPASGRFTFVTDDTLSKQGAFGVDPGEKMKFEIGPYFRADLNKDLAKNINLATTLELFTDYMQDFGNIDVNWSLLITMKVNKWLAASISTQVIYDHDIDIKTSPGGIAGPKTQFKEMIGIGLSYKFD